MGRASNMTTLKFQVTPALIKFCERLPHKLSLGLLAGLGPGPFKSGLRGENA